MGPVRTSSKSRPSSAAAIRPCMKQERSSTSYLYTALCVCASCSVASDRPGVATAANTTTNYRQRGCHHHHPPCTCTRYTVQLPLKRPCAHKPKSCKRVKPILASSTPSVCWYLPTYLTAQWQDARHAHMALGCCCSIKCIGELLWLSETCWRALDATQWYHGSTAWPCKLSTQQVTSSRHHCTTQYCANLHAASSKRWPALCRQQHSHPTPTPLVHVKDKAQKGPAHNGLAVCTTYVAKGRQN